MEANEKPVTLSVYDFMKLYPNEESVNRWFVQRRWNNSPVCPHCKSKRIANIINAKPMPYRCMDCREYFSVRTGTVMEGSKISLHKWLYAIYLMTNARKGISSIQLSKELGVTQKTAWFLEHRIRETCKSETLDMLGPIVEIDECYIGGKEANKHASKKLHAGRGPVGKKGVMGIVERGGQIRAFTLRGTEKSDFHQEINKHVKKGSMIYTDDHKSYHGLKDYNHESVNHSAGEYVRGMASTNGVESFWALLKRGYYGTFHNMSYKHLDRYINEFSTRHNVGRDTNNWLNTISSGMIGKRLTYKRLIQE